MRDGALGYIVQLDGARIPGSRDGTVDIKMDEEMINRLVAVFPEIEPLKDNRSVLRDTAAAWLCRWYVSYVFELPRVPCNCSGGI